MITKIETIKQTYRSRKQNLLRQSASELFGLSRPKIQSDVVMMRMHKMEVATDRSRFKLFFSSYFDIEESVLQQYGALNICLDSDLPLFIDPFLLFSSSNAKYIDLHKNVVNHLIFLKSLVAIHDLNLSIFQFKEKKQNWLGWCKWGNEGRGLGPKFAKILVAALRNRHSDFGDEKATSPHIEKLTLMGSGIGRDFISDFTTNLIFEFLLEYTQEFSLKNLKAEQRKIFSIRCVFDQENLIWLEKKFTLPFLYRNEKNQDYIVLTPIDILTKDEAFINNNDLSRKFGSIVNSLSDSEIRSSINRLFDKKIGKNASTAARNEAIQATIAEFPIVVDEYIRKKESQKEVAKAISEEKINSIYKQLVLKPEELASQLDKFSDFYSTKLDSYEEALARVYFLKKVIEENDGYRIFYSSDGKPAPEDTIQRIFRLTWFATPFDVNSEVNNGRGPADYKISLGSRDATIVEFKLGSSSSIEKNLNNQTLIYRNASGAINDIVVILCYTNTDIAKVERIIEARNRQNLEPAGPTNIVIPI